MLKSKFFKNCLALFLITLVAGVALASVNEITKQPIANAEEKAKYEAYDAVFSDAEFKSLEGDSTVQSKFKSQNGTAKVDEVLSATDKSGKNIGYVMTASSQSGYGGEIKVAVGISNDKKITGVTILSHSETAGLGAKCDTDEFKSQFSGKSASKLTYVKDGATTDTEIDAISGATITTNAVTEAVNAALDFYNSVLEVG